MFTVLQKAKKHPSQAKVHNTVAAVKGDFARLLAGILKGHVAGISVTKLERLIRQGNIQAVIDALELDKLDAAIEGGISEGLARALALGAKTAMEELRSGIEFDILRESALKWIDDHGAKLVVQVSQAQREGVNKIVRGIVTQGWHPKEAAGLIRQSVGLHTRFADAVRRYYDTLIASGIKSDRALTQAAKYADRLRDKRAETIARTEAMSAVNRGRQEYWKQLKDRGAFTGKRIMREWLVSPDERLCDICAPMDGQRRKIDDPFVAGDGTLVDAPPVHPNCRCTVRLVEVRR